MTVLSVWGTIGSIALFILALSVLIVIHEAGHFIAAKSFKVYCSDFSIGFGPKIIKIKRKKGETTFNVGIIPLGGYVSMYGEGIDLPDGKKIDKSRSLNGINRWKRAVIMAAGIIMNFVLAFILFFIAASCFPQHRYYINAPVVTNSDKYQESLRVVVPEAEEAFEFKENDTLALTNYQIKINNKETIIANMFVAADAEINPESKDFLTSTYTATIEGKEYTYVFGLNFQTPKQSQDFSNGIIAFQAELYKAEDVKYPVYDDKTEKTVYVPFTRDIYLPKFEEGQPLIFKFSETSPELAPTFNVLRSEVEGETTKLKPVPFQVKLQGTKENAISPLYFGSYDYTYWNGWNSFEAAGKQFAHSTTMVAKALGGLFVGQNWDQVGGPLAIFNQSTMILNEYPFSEYLNVWGVISVNLALFNLLPFPGLDGWQLLVTGIEGTVNLFTRNKYRAKFGKKKAKVNKNSKPEGEIEVVTTVESEEPGKYDLETLKKLAELNNNIADVEKAYFYKFNKKYDHEALLNAFSDPEKEEENNQNEEYKYFVDHNNAVHEYEEYVLLNNLEEVKPFKEWGIPERVKNIVSYIGLGLLMALALVIFIMDIVKMF